VADITVEVDARAAGAVGVLDRVAGKVDGLKSRAGGAGSVLKGVLSANVITAGAGAALDGLKSLAGGLTDVIGEARESQKVGATTAQIIKSTGARPRSAPATSGTSQPR
jgi:hypothetical protein